MFPRIPFCNPPKNPHLHHCLSKEYYFSPSYVGFFGFLVSVRVSQRKQGKQEPSYLLSISLLFVFLVTLSTSRLSSLLLSSLFLTRLFFFELFISLSISISLSTIVPFGFWVPSFCALMKKTRRAVVMESSPYAMYEDPRTIFKHQSLLQDFEELQKETEDMTKKLQILKQKKLTLSAEVRFLRRRYKYLITNESSNHLTKRDFVEPQKFDIQLTSTTTNRKNYRKKEAALRPPVQAPDLNRKERIYNVTEAHLQKPALVFDMNQKARTFNGKGVALQTSAPIFDMNQKERIFSGKDATKRLMTPVFDLNQISTEEELVTVSEPSRMEEPRKSLLRGGSDEQHNDMKLSICRNVGNGSNRAGKRKISWQDQMALRV